MIHRTHKTEHFTVLANDLLRHPRLSYKAKAIFADILSHDDDFIEKYRLNTADGYHRYAGLKYAKSIGREACQAVFKELAAEGFVARVKVRLPSGEFGWGVDLHEDPSPENRTMDTADNTAASRTTPSPGLPPTVHQATVHQATVNPPSNRRTGEKNQQEKKHTESSSAPTGAEERDDDHPCVHLSGEELPSSPSAQGAASSRPNPSPGPSAARPREDRGYFLDPEVEEGHEDWMERQIIKPLCPDLNIRAYARHCVASGYDAQDVLDMLCVCAAGNLPGFTGHMNGAMLNKCLDEMMEAHHRHEAENVAEQAEREAYEQASAEREAHAAGEAEERNAERARREQQAADEKEAERERSRQEAERQSAEREARLQEQRHERQQLIEDLAALRGVNPTRVEADLAAEHIGGIDNQSRWLRKQIKLLAGA